MHPRIMAADSIFGNAARNPGWFNVAYKPRSFLCVVNHFCVVNYHDRHRQSVRLQR
jgi:hypothetical protein